MTDYILISRSTPTTDFYLECDRVGQSQSGNYTTLRMYLRCVNRGNTTSQSNNAGFQAGQVDGVGEVLRYSATPFLASGVGTNVQRWRYGPGDVNIGHGSDGTRGAVTLRMIVDYLDNRNIQATASFSDFPRIPKPPSAPGTPTYSDILPQSVKVSWTASTNDNGSAITGYLLRRYETADGTGAYVDTVVNALNHTVTGLTPGKTYSFRVYAMNSSAGVYSSPSGPTAVTTLAPARIRVNGVYKFAIPYVRVGGVYKMALPFVRSGGVYKKTG